MGRPRRHYEEAGTLTCIKDASDRATYAKPMKTVDATDGEIRFTAHWGGQDRYVFVPDPYVSDDAGYPVSRDEAIAYVQEHLERYRQEAHAQQGNENPEKIVILKRPPRY